MFKVAPSILAADFLNLGNDIEKVCEAGADLIHLDIMDGHFVPNITFGPDITAMVAKVSKVPVEAHLMIENPDNYINAFFNAGASIIIVHPEVCYHLHRTIHKIKELGIKAGVALNPATPLNVLEYVLQDLDMILIMTVDPGFGGQSFLSSMVPKLMRLRDLLLKRQIAVDVAVDGGIDLETVSIVAAAGANVFVAGTSVFHSTDYKETISLMKEKARIAVQ